jgi:hypothetical protein
MEPVESNQGLIFSALVEIKSSFQLRTASRFRPREEIGRGAARSGAKRKKPAESA